MAVSAWDKVWGMSSGARDAVFKNAKWIPRAASRTVPEAYRRLLASVRTVMWGDEGRWAATAEVNSVFRMPLESAERASKGLSSTLPEALREADQASEMIMTSIVQGKLDEDSGHVAVKVEPRNVANKKDMKLSHGDAEPDAPGCGTKG